MPVSVGTHKTVFEYDGAFQCQKCGQKWGALPGVSRDAPRTCSTDEIYITACDLLGLLTQQTRILNDKENSVAAALALYCGNHRDNPFNT